MTIVKGFVRAGFCPTSQTVDNQGNVISEDKGGVIFSPNGLVFVHLTYDTISKLYTFMGTTLFYEHTIPREYHAHEFIELYQSKRDPTFTTSGVKDEIGMIIFDQFSMVLTGKSILKEEK